MRTELSFIMIIVLACFAKYMRWPGADIILIMSMGLLALIYFPLGAYFLSYKKMKNSIVALSVISGLAISILVLGVLFKIQHYPGAHLMILVGLAIGIGSLGTTYFLSRKETQNLIEYFKYLKQRLIVFISIGCGLMIFL
ncbi:MAG: GldL-related protein [Bacteroidia bacterium]